MRINTEIKNAITAAGLEAQYDDRAKRLLSNKNLLAYLLVKTVDEFRGMNPQDVVPYIEGDPYVGTVPADPGLTNAAAEKNGRQIIGMNTEDTEIREGLARFDILFYVRMKDGLSQVIVNLELQKDEPAGYPILNRAVFYASRLISSQKERDFTGTDYDGIKRVFSIWILMNARENRLSHIHLTKEDLMGPYSLKGRLDLLNLVMIGVGRKLPEREEKYELHRLLGTILSADLSVDEKCKIVESEYQIPIEKEMKEELDVMCNLSQGILEIGEARGEARGVAIGEAQTEARFIFNMYKKGYALEQIADVAGKSEEMIRDILEK